MDAQAVKTFFVEQIKWGRDAYIRDLEALGEEDLANSPGGTARSAYDYTYEVAFNNERFAARLRGETPKKTPEGWMSAPTDYRNKQAAIEYIRTSTDEFLAAFEAVPAEDLLKTIVLENDTSNALEYANMCTSHMGYHDAQLNLVQSMRGDSKMHWFEG